MNFKTNVCKKFQKISILPPQKGFCFAAPPPPPPRYSSLDSHFAASKILAFKDHPSPGNFQWPSKIGVGMDYFWNYTIPLTSAQVTSVLVIPWDVSSIFLTPAPSDVSQNEGHPEPESNLVSDRKRTLPQTVHLYTPCFLLPTSSPVNALIWKDQWE